jgi:hypothetical protein
MPPATPPNVAPMANASSFMCVVLMPIARAATSVLADRLPRTTDARILQADV